jgi:hypothetical protein
MVKFMKKDVADLIGNRLESHAFGRVQPANPKPQLALISVLEERFTSLVQIGWAKLELFFFSVVSTTGVGAVKNWCFVLKNP